MGPETRGGSKRTSYVQPPCAVRAFAPHQRWAVLQVGGTWQPVPCPEGAHGFASPQPLAPQSGTTGWNSAELYPHPDSRSATRSRSAFNHRSSNYSAALIINFLHSKPVPGESPSFLATVQRERNLPPSAGRAAPLLLTPLLHNTVPQDEFESLSQEKPSRTQLLGPTAGCL